ncbi:DUF1549 and DUF1553 domain-containing protein, partial [Verrucomicrobiales bacterium]|nr:DUF1549 and DUF1553 domain-containing protein [Verrucomicrobiales bacterium]
VFAGDEFNKAAAIKKIDQLVEAGLKKHDQKRGAAIDDHTFVRRAYLDIIGRIPTIEESENFLGSTDEKKREQLIADLLESDGHVSHSYNFWADVLRINSGLGTGAEPAEAAYQLWIKEAVANNIPYDEMVYEMVSATGMIWNNGVVGYYIRDTGMPLDSMSQTARIFLGTRLECAQCHDHPFDKWTQMDYYKMAAFSYGMDARGYTSENRKAYNAGFKAISDKLHNDVLEKAGFKGVRFPQFYDKKQLEIFTKNQHYQSTLDKLEMSEKEFRDLAEKSIAAREKQTKGAQYVMRLISQDFRAYSNDEKKVTLKLPHDYQYDDASPHDAVEAKIMFGAEIDLANIDESSIEAYAKWMTSEENPTFTKVIANRLWKRVFGHGVFEPLDDLTDYTHVANPELLDYITELVTTLDYNVQAYLDILYNTRTYQSAAYNGEVVMGAPYHFPGPVLRRMTAEQIWDSIVALALPEADSYRPRLKTQLAQIEKYRQMYIALEEQPQEDYIAMIGKIGGLIKDTATEKAKIREQILEAQKAKDDEKFNQLRGRERVLSREMASAIRQVAFRNADQKVDSDALLAAGGMSEMAMSSGGAMMSDDGMAKRKNGVMTQLPAIEMPKYEAPEPPQGLDANQMRSWKKQQSDAERKWQVEQAAELKDFKKLVADMARASELESPAPRGHFLREFGQSDREVIENAASHASVPQALNLLNGTTVEMLTNQFAVFGRRLHAAGDSKEKTKMIFQAMLTREPTDREMDIVMAEIDAKGDEAYESIVWALLNTQQFMFVQ